MLKIFVCLLFFNSLVLDSSYFLVSFVFQFYIFPPKELRLKYDHANGLQAYLNKPVQRIKRYQGYLKVIFANFCRNDVAFTVALPTKFRSLSMTTAVLEL